MKKIFLTVIMLTLTLLITGSAVVNARDDYEIKKGEVLTWKKLNSSEFINLLEPKRQNKFKEGGEVFVPRGAKLKITFFNVNFIPEKGFHITNPTGIRSCGQNFRVPEAPKFCSIVSQYTYDHSGKKILANWWAKYSPNKTKATIYVTVRHYGHLMAGVNDYYYDDNIGYFSLTIERLK